MKYRHINYDELDQKKYLEMFNKAAVATPFHSLQWLDIMKDLRHDLELKFVLINDDTAQTIAYMPYFSKENIPITMASSIVSGYGGFIYEECNKETIRKFINRKNFCKLISIINIYEDSLYAELDYLHLRLASTWILDCTKRYEEIFEGIASKARNQIRRAFKSDIIYTDISTDSQIQDCKNLYNQLVEKHSIEEPYPTLLFDKLFQASLEKQDIMFKVAIYKNKVISFCVFITAKRHMFYWLNASDKNYSSLNATNGLLANMIEWCSQNHDMEIFNFGAVPHENSGLMHFKTNWGAYEKKCNVFVTKVYSMIRG